MRVQFGDDVRTVVTNIKEDLLAKYGESCFEDRSSQVLVKFQILKKYRDWVVCLNKKLSSNIQQKEYDIIRGHLEGVGRMDYLEFDNIFIKEIKNKRCK